MPLADGVCHLVVSAALTIRSTRASRAAPPVDGVHGAIGDTPLVELTRHLGTVYNGDRVAARLGCDAGELATFVGCDRWHAIAAAG